MLSDSAEETPTLTMDELQLQLPRTALQPALSPSPPPPPLYSLKSSSTSSELVEFPDTGLDFYSSPFDNSFPYRGILSNERSFSCSSPNSNTSFLSETSFSKQSLLRNSQDSGIASESFGLLTATSTPYRGNDANFSLDFQRILTGGGGAVASAFSNDELAPPPGANFVPSSQALNDSMLSTSSIDCSTGLSSSLVKWSSPSKVVTSTPSNIQFDFSFPTMSEPNMGGGMCMNNDSGVGSSNGSSNASVDSPSRLLAAVSEAGTISCSYPSTQWSSGDAAIMGPQVPESPNDNAVVSTSAFNASIWSPSSQASAGMCNTMTNASGSMGEFVTGNNQASSNSLSLDQELKGLSKDQLVSFVELLKQKLGESLHNQDEVQANQLQSAIVEVQQHIISTFLYEPSESSGSVSTPTRTVASPIMSSPTDNSLDRQARMHREDNGSENRTKDAPYTWSGHLPPRIHRNPTYSCKVFLGGLPWDITEAILMQTFKPFGMMKIEWPGKDCVTSTRPRGYAYAVFETEKQVKLLLQNCTHDYNNCRAGNYYYKISSKKFRGKDVQIIPWAVSDSNFTRIQASKIDPLRTIFVGALHGMVNAEGLATIMNDLFGGVVYAGIDTDRSKYPIGSARVTFNNTRSYLKAVRAAFVHIKTPRFDKKLQVDPYLEDATCSICKLQQGPYFCRDTSCFSYFCRTCFQYKHSDPKLRSHNPMMRTHNKASQPQQQSVVMNSALFSGPNNRSSGFNVNHNHQNQQMSYNYSGPNNHTNTGYQGFPSGQGTTRQWNGGRNSPQGGYSGGGQCPPTYGFNGLGGGVGNKFPHINGVHFGGGCNNNGNNFPHPNKFFGQVGHRQQQQQQYNRW